MMKTFQAGLENYVNSRLSQLAIVKAVVCAVLAFKFLASLQIRQITFDIVSFSPSASGLMEFTARHPLLFVVVSIITAVLVSLSIGGRLLIALLLAFNEMYRSICLSQLDGGDNMTKIVLILLLGVPTRSTAMRKNDGFLDVLLTSACIFSMHLQLAFVYLQAGLSKAADSLWSKGVGVYYSAHIYSFSKLPAWAVLSENQVIGTLLNYFVIAWQLSFWITLFTPRSRAAMFMIGWGFHLFIALTFGLYSFGVIFMSLFLVCAPWNQWQLWSFKLRDLLDIMRSIWRTRIALPQQVGHTASLPSSERGHHTLSHDLETTTEDLK